MEKVACFASAVALTHRREPSAISGRRGSILCTIAPKRTDRTNRSKQTRTKKAFRVLPADLPESERPPSVSRHHAIPYIGFMLGDWIGKRESSTKLAEKYGGVINSNYHLDDMTYVMDYDVITSIFRSPDVFTSINALPGIDSMFKNAILTSDGPEHAAARSLLAPAFSTSMYSYYFPFVANRARVTWARVHERVRNGETVKLDPVFREHYLALTIEMTTGQDAEGTVSARIRNLFSKLQYGLLLYKFGPIGKASFDARDELLQVLRDVVCDNLIRRRDIIERLRSYDGDIAKLCAKDIKTGEVDVLLVAIATSSLSTEPGAKLDDEVVDALANSMMLLWLAGYMTSAATSTSAALELGMDPTICAKLVAEQNALVAEAGGVRDVTYEQTASRMPLLDSYLTEILRLCPPVTGMNRVSTCDVEILNRFIPKGRNLLCSFEAAQRDPKIYPEPNKLIPERFLANPKPPPILSFGIPGSPHYCIGAFFAKTMMRTTFATMLREYSITLDPSQSREYKHIPDKCPESLCVVADFQPRK